MDTSKATTSSRSEHVVVVGAGFAGLNVARRLAASDRNVGLRVTVVDRHNYHTFQPLLYQVATAMLEPQSIGRNVRSIIRASAASFRMGTVTGVDWDARHVELADGGVLSFDTLVLAAGATTADYGIEGVAERTWPLKSLPDATRLRNHILRRFEQAEFDPSTIDAGGLTFVVAGGGPTGVELAGALAELVDRVVRKDHPRIDVERVRIIIVEMLHTLLPGYSERNRRYASRTLAQRGVEVRVGTAIEGVGSDRVRLSDGDEIPTATVIWTAGVRASPLGDVLGVEQTEGGRIAVDRHLRIPGRPAYVIGDLAGAADERGVLYPQLAPVAIQQGRYVAEHVLLDRGDQPMPPFQYREKGTMATIGRNAAVAELPFGLSLRGLVAWFAWLGLHIVYLIGFRNRAIVLVNWAYNYLTYDRAARIILEHDEPDEPDALRHSRA